MIRLASYNVRKCIGTDRRRDPERTLSVIDALGADIVALQEADRRLGRRHSALPADRIGRHVDLVPVPVPARTAGLGHHGNALLARPGIEIRASSVIDLPGLEPRGAIMAEFDLEGDRLRIIAAHLGLLRRDRREQIGALCEIAGEGRSPCVIVGDFNEWRQESDALPLPEHFHWLRPGPSFHSRLRLAALDGIILGPGVRAGRWGVERSRLARRASDHLPIWADITIDETARTSSSEPAAPVARVEK